MTDPVSTARLRELERLSLSLDPGPDERARLLEQVAAHVQAFLAGVDREPTYRPDDGAAAALARAGVPARPRAVDDTLGLLAATVEHTGVSVTSPRYLGYVPAGGLFHSALAGLLAGVSNRYSGLAEISPGAAALEAVIVRWLADTVGYPEQALGVLTSGGSLATVTAIATARDHAEVVADRIASSVVYSTSETHLCLDKALRLCGLGSVVRRRIGIDAGRRMRPADLSEAIAADRSAGLLPWLLAATAGTVNTGSVDPLADLADLAATERLWLHVDGAYGGLYAACPEGRAVLGGMDRSDSLVVDPHKTLFLPYGTGTVLIHEGRRLAESFAADAAYLDRDLDLDAQSLSAADLSPELTRPFRALGLWLPLQLAGAEAFTAALSEKLLLARHVHQRLTCDPLIETGPAPDLAIVAFRALPRSGDVDAFNIELTRRLQQAGIVYVTPTRLDGHVFLRVAVGSFRTHLDDVDLAVDTITAEARAATR